jgi:hypothetical protein
MYILILKDTKGNALKSRELGSWRDHAREVFAGTRARLNTAGKPFILELVDTYDNTIELTYTAGE